MHEVLTVHGNEFMTKAFPHLELFMARTDTKAEKPCLMYLVMTRCLAKIRAYNLLDNQRAAVLHVTPQLRVKY